MNPLFRFFGSLFLLFFWGDTFVLAQSQIPSTAPPLNQTAYIQRLIKQAETQNLSQQRFWHLLLHYRPDWLGGHTSEIDNPGFFLSSEGRSNPKMELEATLSSFFSDALVGPSQQQAQCAFPARYRWLNEQLKFDATLLPPRNCERFHKALGSLKIDTITIIFADAFMNSPSSMFGHTLLRLDNKAEGKNHPLLSYAINYGANVTTDNPFAYAYLGLTGGFDGTFSILPYYIKVKEYVEWENRDLWEYELHLTQDQIDWMILHLWELGNAQFDYYFFRENCSYHLLSLIEVARPELHLTDDFDVWTAPLETVRLLLEQDNLFQSTTFRPARSTKIQANYDKLLPSEQRTFLQLIDSPESLDSIEFQAHAPARQARLLDLASDYFRYKTADDFKNKTTYQKRQRQLLSLRSTLDHTIDDSTTIPEVSPEQGHETSRISGGVGATEDKAFIELAYRAGYHTLMDNHQGFVPYSQIQALDVRMRHFSQGGLLRIESFTVVDIVSLFPSDDLFTKPSWSVKALGERWQESECEGCPFYTLSGGVGLSKKMSWEKPTLVYGLLQGAFNVIPFMENKGRLGAGVMTGIITDFSQQWRFHIYSSYLGYFSKGSKDEVQWTLQHRYSLGQNLALAFDGSVNGPHKTLKTLVHYYF